MYHQSRVLSTGGQKMEQTAKTVSPMSNEGRNAYVTEHITAAMLSLLKEKPLV